MGTITRADGHSYPADGCTADNDEHATPAADSCTWEAVGDARGNARQIVFPGRVM
jgi:hypothetical protein